MAAEEDLVTLQNKGKILETRRIPIATPKKSPEFLLVVSEDITKRKGLEEREKKLEAQLRHLQKMEALGTLASGIAHDFNNVLAPIIGYTELLLLKSIKGDEFQESLSAILNASLRARDLVQQILTFSRQGTEIYSPVAIHPVVKESIKLLQSTLPPSIRVQDQIDETCPPVVGNATHLHQVIMNLCTNAYHAMKETGGVLAIELAPVELSEMDNVQFPGLASGSFIRLSVSDTGVGMTRDVLDRIFDPYFTTREKGEGTGLGLSLVHGIIKAHSGTVRAYSEPGKGAVFHVYLPAAPDLSDTGKDVPPQVLPGGRERILYVDDEEQLAEMTRQMLIRLGYQVTAVTSSVQAFDLFEKNPDQFDLVVSDLAMPDLTGLELAQKVTAVRPNLPVIICTGFSERMNTDLAKSIGIIGFLMKPVVYRDLALTVRKTLDKAFGDLV